MNNKQIEHKHEYSNDDWLEPYVVEGLAGLICFNAKAYETAIEIFSKIIKEDTNYRIIIRLAISYFGIGKYREGFNYLYTFFLKHPLPQGWYWSIGEIIDLIKENNDKKKKAEILNLEKDYLHYDNFASCMILSIIKYFDNDFDSMETYIKKAEKLKTDDFIFFYLAECYFEKDEYDKAIDLFEKHEISSISDEEGEISYGIYFMKKCTCYLGTSLEHWKRAEILDAENILARSIEFIKTEIKKELPFQNECLIEIAQRRLDAHNFFYEMMLFDSQFEEIYKVDAFCDLNEKLLSLRDYIKSSETLQKANFGEYIYFKIGKIKLSCVFYLLKTLLIFFPEQSAIKEDEFKIFDFQEAKKLLADSGFIKGKASIEGIENFALELQRTKPEGIIKKEKELIAFLKPSYVLVKELSIHMIEQKLQEKEEHRLILDGIRRLEEKMSVGKSEEKETDKKDWEYEEEIELNNKKYLFKLLKFEIKYINYEPEVILIVIDKKDNELDREILKKFEDAEKQFALLVRLAVARITKEGWLSKYNDLYFKSIPGEKTRDGELDELRNLLMKSEILKRIMQLKSISQKKFRELFIKADGKGSIRLAILESNIIISAEAINNLKNFKCVRIKEKKKITLSLKTISKLLQRENSKIEKIKVRGKNVARIPSGVVVERLIEDTCDVYEKHFKK